MELLLFVFMWIIHLKMDLNREIIYELYERRKFKSPLYVFNVDLANFNVNKNKINFCAKGQISLHVLNGYFQIKTIKKIKNNCLFIKPNIQILFLKYLKNII